MAVVDEDFDWLWQIFYAGNLELAQNMCPTDFNWASLEPGSGRTVLQTLIDALQTADDTSQEQTVFDMAEWMIAQGADPTLKASYGAEYDVFFKDGFEDKEELHVTVIYENKSAISTVLCLIAMMKEQTSTDNDKIDWSEDITDLKKLLSVFGRAGPHANEDKVTVATGVVDLWELMCQDSASHDVTVQAHDGPVTAHAIVLSKASPVLAAMLTAEMSEGQKRRIDVEDASAESVKLLLSLMYTGTTTKDFGHAAALAALDLAHRWQANVTVGMLENALAGMISDGHFASIAEAAQLKGLPALTRACRRFGSTSKFVQGAYKRRLYKRPVLELMGALREGSRPSKKTRTW